MRNSCPRLLLAIIVLVALLPTLARADDASGGRPAPTLPFGMNLYITGLERPRAGVAKAGEAKRQSVGAYGARPGPQP